MIIENKEDAIAALNFIEGKINQMNKVLKVVVAEPTTRVMIDKLMDYLANTESVVHLDADELKERLKEYCIDGDKKAKEWYEIMGIDDGIDKAPTIEAVEVVRCKDCIYRDKCHKYISISKWDNEIKCHYTTFPKITFCSYGKRKDEKEDGKAN